MRGDRVGGLAVAAILGWTACASPQNRPTPGFSVEYRLVSRMPTCRGNRRVHIDSAGAVRTAKNVVDCAPGESWSTPYPAQPARTLDAESLAALEREIESSGVLGDVASADSTTVSDGAFEEIEITRGADRRTIRVLNPRAGPFVRARAAILRAIGEGA